jgi:quinol monooxygenase YgiN
MLQQIVRLTVSFSVDESHLEAFKRIAATMTERSKAEPGTLGYEWFVSSDSRRFRLVETYSDATAVEAHFTGTVVQEWVPKLAAVSTVDGFEFYGDPGPKVAAMAAGFGAAFYEYWLGIER